MLNQTVNHHFALETCAQSGYDIKLFRNKATAQEAFSHAFCFSGDIRILQGNFEELPSGHVVEHGRTSVLEEESFDVYGELH